MVDTHDYLIIAIENPLLDISIDLENEDLLKKYELTHGLASLASEKQLPLYDEVWAVPKKMTTPGGSSLNSVRAANYMLTAAGHTRRTAFIGSIGNDEFGRTLETELSETGVSALFHKDEATPTGTCAVLVLDNERTLVANLAACLKYPTTHLEAHAAALEKTQFFYTSAFFITSNYEAMVKYAEYALAQNKPLGYNLSAPFLIQFNTEQVNNVLQYADFVFCNESEAQTFADVNKVAHSNLKDVTQAIANWPKKNSNRNRVAVVTQGKEPILFAVQQKDGEPTVEVKEIPVTVLSKEQLVDTNGAGDSFVGGFLSQIVQGKSVEQAIQAGIWLSTQVIQRSGCTFPEVNTFQQQ